MNSMNAVAAPVLVVDDDPLLSGMAARTLRHAGFEVVTAASGEEALALCDGTRFALVLLDVMMPGLDGYETCLRLRAMPQGATVPVLMLTGLNDTASIEHAYQAGATDFIVKPIHWTLLAQRVRYAIRAAASAESALLNRERLERAQRIASMGSWEMSVDGSTMACSAVFESLFGQADAAAAPRSPAALLERVHADDRQRVHAAREAALQAGVPYQLSFRIRRFDGGERTVFEQALPVFDSVGRQRGVEGITQDITERVEAERRASQLARYDRITGLPNRDFFAELAAPALERTARLGTRCALLHLDIDQFKSVNDALGTAEGDGILRLIGERLAACLRVADLAGAAGDVCVARVGANTFTLLLVDSGDERQAAAVVERLQRAVSQPIAVRGRELTLTASVGVALYPRDSSEVKRLLSCAEQACYAAKAAGRGQQRFFDEAMNAAASARLLRESELRRAIGDGQLRLHYQPKVDAVAGRTIGAEALVRWQHPERGLVPPGEFIALAEESGLIVELTQWVLATACADQRRRLDAGLPALPVAVNIAGTSFMRDDLHVELDGLLQRHGLDASCLVLEVTESMLMKDVQLAVERLQQLRARGFRISLDDFGTGYSSLSYLQRFAIDELKIDRSFVADAGRGGRGSAIARSIIALGREFGLDVVAEGVETASQAELLIQHGCRTHQGFLFARPMPGADFDALLTREAGVSLV